MYVEWGRPVAGSWAGYTVREYPQNDQRGQASQRSAVRNNYPARRLDKESFNSSPSSEHVPLAPDEQWVDTAPENYADDTPYIPPSIRSTHKTSNARSAADVRQPPADRPTFPVEPQYYPPQSTGIHQAISPRLSEHGYESGSAQGSSSPRTGVSGSYSSGEGGVSHPGDDYNRSPAYQTEASPPSAHPHLGHYPQYDHYKRSGEEYSRDDATDRSSSALSYYRPQTHTYGESTSPSLQERQPHRVGKPPPPNPTQAPAQPSIFQQRPNTVIRTMHTYPVPVEQIPDPEPNLRQILGVGPNQEINLSALDDPPPGEKPNYPYPTLAKLAIHGSLRKRLTLQEIYTALEDRFEWFKHRSTTDTAWKRSIRHLLSLNKTFRKVPRPVTDPGKGSYWMVDYSQGEGNKRVRKRNKKPTKAQLARQAAEADHQMGASVSGSGAGPSQSGSDSEGSGDDPRDPTYTSSFDASAIDPALSAQGHIVGAQRPVPRSRTHANSPYNTRTSSKSVASSATFPSTSFTAPSFGQSLPGINTIDPNRPTFGAPSFAITTNAVTGNNTSTNQPSGSTSINAFANYQGPAISLYPGRSGPMSANNGSRVFDGTQYTLPPLNSTQSRNSSSPEDGPRFSLDAFNPNPPQSAK